MAEKKESVMFEDFKRVPTKSELLFDLVAFSLALAAAIIQDWRAADIVWAAWLSSLLVGLSFYVIITIKMMGDKARGVELEAEKGSGPGCLGTGAAGFMGFIAFLSGPGSVRNILIGLIIITVIGMVMNVLAPKRRFGLNPEHPVNRVLLFIPAAMFLFFFFLGHFGGFHLGFSLFMGFLVPLELDIPGTVDTLAGARDMFFTWFVIMILEYWPYLLSAFVMNIGAYQRAMESDEDDFMILPYKSIIRFYFLIMVMGFVYAIGSGRGMMIIALFFFFFPVEGVVAWYRERTDKRKNVRR